MLGIFALVATLFVALDAPVAAQGASECGPNINKIVCENQKPGTDPEEWDITGAGDSSIQGFATDISVNVGSTIDFKIDTDATNYTIDIYRTGWYQGLGARHIASVTPSAALPQNQPECISDLATELYDCGTWNVSASWNVPSNAVSGVYIASLRRTDTGGQSHITFIVREDGNTSDVLFQTSDPTWHAYNTYGGSDFYQGAGNGRAYKISYNRPFATRGHESGRDFYFSSEYATVRFLERNGYDMSYIAGVDTDRRGGELLNHNVFLSVGHDEYWSGAQRANIEAARDAGVNLQFLTGNEGYWRTRYEASTTGANGDHRTLVSYKETWGNSTNRGGGKIDASSPEWTGTWRDPRFAPQSQGGGLPENAVTGTMYFVNHDDLPLTVNADEGKYRLWRNTGLDSLASGAKAELAPHTVGYESNEVSDNGFSPAGLIKLSTTVGPTPQYLTDYGNTVVEGTTQHHVTLYRAPSTALVFSAASIQWGWGLDETHDGNGAPADSRMQQAQVNLLADMDAQPGSLMQGLVPATKTTDATPPSVTITSPTAGATVAHGSTVTVTGTASDVGGRVAGVEVSTDGGTVWRTATGTTSWTYTGIQQGIGSTQILVRATDDSANYSTTPASRSITVAGPYTAFGGMTPESASTDDAQAVELGLKFSVAVDGEATGVRFYKGPANGGTHVGSLWNSAGTRLATVTFTNESASGWQTASFASPVDLIAGQTYTVSYTAPQGGYAMAARFWPYDARPSAPVQVASGVGSAAPGVYGAAGTFPASAYNESNYFVDVVFESAAESPLRIQSRTPAVSATGVGLSAPVTVTFTRDAAPSSVSLTVAEQGGANAAGTTTYNAATRTATFTPSAAYAPSTIYTVTPAATDTQGIALVEGSSWSFTTKEPDQSLGECPCTIFPESRIPTIASANDTALVTLGTRFEVSTPGTIRGVKFYKGSLNTGVHQGSLWKADGTRLATIAFTNESATGWQTAYFATPVPVEPGVQYIAGYLAPFGGYAATGGAFASAAYERTPFTVPVNGGAFTYSDGFPGTSSTTDYGVDVVFAPLSDSPTIVTQTPASGATGVGVSSTISATFSTAIAGGFTGTVLADGSAVAGTWTRTTGNTVAQFTPSAPLPRGVQVTVSLSGIASVGGTSGPAVDWSFTTVPASADGSVSLLEGQTPVTSTTDTGAVELGMAFTSSVPGQVRAIRFFKASGNTGIHTGSLWGPSGTRLAQVTFVGESASGWQRAVLSTPVDIAAGAVYTVSYHAPQGNYSFTSSAFASPMTNGPLTAVSPDNGRFRYGSGGVRPTESWNSTNYFVDVEFMPTAEDPTVIATEPASGATGASASANITATFDRAVAESSVSVEVSTAAGAAVAGATTYNATNRRVTFDPTSALAADTPYTATVKIDGNVVSSWGFRTAAEGSTVQTQTIFGSEAPELAAADDTSAVEVGTAFQVSEAGTATAVRFFKAATNTGVHRGTLWSETGTVLAQVDFADETASGWQRMEFSQPVELEPGVTYTVSVFNPNGRYSVTSGYFATPKISGKITAPALTNGRFFYGGSGGFPVDSWGSSAYFVDAEIEFSSTTTAAPAVTTTTPAASATNVAPDTAVISATLTDATSATISVTDDGAPVDGSSTFTATSGVVTFTPAAALARGKTYIVTVAADGSAVPGGSWSFATTPSVALQSTTPSAGATSVNPASVSISATLANASAASIALVDGTTPVEGSSSFTAPTGTVVFTPTAVLGRGKTYTVTVTADGAAVPQGSWSFTTTPAASLTATTPAASATNVDPATASITATLTNAAAGAIAVTSNGSAVAGTSSFNSATGVVTFTPSAALVRARTYSATVTADGQAVSGGTWTFTTIPNPAISARTPAASATRVVPGTPITATITNATTAVLTMTSNGSNVAGTSSFNATTGVATFTPAATLAWNRTYSVTATANGAALSGGTWSFTTTPQATRTAISPASGATNVNPATATISATLSNAVTATLALKQGTTDVAGTSAYNTSTGVVTFTPAVTLDWTKVYTATVTANNAAVANGTWSFTTMAKPDQVSMFTTGTPANANASAGSTVQTGTRFRASVPGVVTTIRFYKGTQNTGTHTGYLRTTSGTILGQVTFTGESSSGWQSAVLSTPVRLTPGTEYRVTLYASSGRYSTTQNAFTSPVTYGPLTALGGVSGFGTSAPTSTVTSNFWVDVVFDPDN
ncbi:Ig-like domain-containing protein [Microbacterium sp. SLBN-146]|nr:Ig-like domain-containing protein [Microbacterium sp. SLBN-146]